MIKIKSKRIISLVVLALIAFFAVSLSFLCYNILNAKNEVDDNIKTAEELVSKNIFVAVENSETHSLDTNIIVNLNPKTKNIKTIYIPNDTAVEIAGSKQMIKDVVNIGDIEMLHRVLNETIPLPVDYYLIIKSNDLYSENGNYREVLRYMFSKHLWEQEDISSYLDEILNLSNTNLTLVKTKEYADFLNEFTEHTNYEYTLLGTHNNINDKMLYVVDPFKINEFVNTEILN